MNRRSNSDLIPRPDALPVGWLWFQILLTLTFVLHLLMMNALVGGSLLALLGGVRRSGPAAMAARDIAHRIPTLVALTVNLGVAPLLFLQVLYGHLFYTSSIVMAAWWFAIIPLLLVGIPLYALSVKKVKVYEVFVVEGATARSRRLRLGFFDSDDVEVLEGLSDEAFGKWKV